MMPNMGQRPQYTIHRQYEEQRCPWLQQPEMIFQLLTPSNREHTQWYQ